MMQLASVNTSAHAKSLIHVINIDTKKWSIQQTNGGTGPGCLFGHSATRVKNGNKDACILFYGGYPKQSKPTNKFHLLNTNVWIWEDIQLSGYLQKLKPRYLHTALSVATKKGQLFSSKILIYGGSNFFQYSTGDLYTCRIKFEKKKKTTTIFGKLVEYNSMNNGTKPNKNSNFLQLSNLPSSYSDAVGQTEDRLSTSRLQQILLENSANKSIQELRRSHHLSTSLKIRLDEPKLSTMQRTYMSRGLPKYNKKYNQKQNSFQSLNHMKTGLNDDNDILKSKMMPESSIENIFIEKKNVLKKNNNGKRKNILNTNNSTIYHNQKLFNGPLKYKHIPSMLPFDKTIIQPIIKGSTGKLTIAGLGQVRKRK